MTLEGEIQDGRSNCSPVSEEEFARLLKPQSDRYHDYSGTLELGRKYFLAAAGCLDPYKETVIDEHGLLVRFEEVYLAVSRLVNSFSPDLSVRLDAIEKELNLSQNVVRIGVFPPGRVRGMDLRGGALSRLVSALVASSFAKAFTVSFKNEREPISPVVLIDIKTAMIRIAGLVGNAAAVAKDWWYDNGDVLIVEDIYDPRRASKTWLVETLVAMASNIEAAPNLVPKVRTALLGEVRAAIDELSVPRTPWNKVMSRLSQVTILLAAIVTMIGGVDDVGENLRKANQLAKDAMSYIARQALSIPDERSLLERADQQKRLVARTTSAEGSGE